MAVVFRQDQYGQDEYATRSLIARLLRRKPARSVGVHLENFPDMAIQILKTMPEHEAVILRLAVGEEECAPARANQNPDACHDLPLSI